MFIQNAWCLSCGQEMALVNFSSFIYKLRRHLFTHRKSRLVRECLIYPSWRSRAITICRGESGRLETKEVCGQSNGTELRPYSVFSMFFDVFLGFMAYHGIGLRWNSNFLLAVLAWESGTVIFFILKGRPSSGSPI